MKWAMMFSSLGRKRVQVAGDYRMVPGIALYAVMPDSPQVRKNVISVNTMMNARRIINE